MVILVRNLGLREQRASILDLSTGVPELKWITLRTYLYVTQIETDARIKSHQIELPLIGLEFKYALPLP